MLEGRRHVRRQAVVLAHPDEVRLSVRRQTRVDVLEQILRRLQAMGNRDDERIVRDGRRSRQAVRQSVRQSGGRSVRLRPSIAKVITTLVFTDVEWKARPRSTCSRHARLSASIL